MEEWRDIKGYEGAYQVSSLGRVKSLKGTEEIIMKAWLRGHKRYRCVGLCKDGIRKRYDIHRLVEGRDLVIGGIKITHEKGLLGHSDADVLVHAIIDAMLGALALDDIGTLFPDTDPKYKNIDSTILTAVSNNLVSDKLEVEISNKDIIPNDYITKLYELKSTPENSIEQFNAFIVLINKCKNWNDMVTNLLIPYINKVKEIKTEIKYFVNAVIDNESIMSIKIPFEQFIDQ